MRGAVGGLRAGGTDLSCEGSGLKAPLAAASVFTFFGSNFSPFIWNSAYSARAASTAITMTAAMQAA